MNKKNIIIIFLYLLYLIGVRILINITYHDWLIDHIPQNFSGSLVWGVIKFLHWCLPIILYLAFVEKNLLGYLKEKYSSQFNWEKVMFFIVIWGILTFITNGFKVPELHAYTIIHDVLVTAFVEEFVFRGFIIDTLSQKFNFTQSNILQSIFFSINHLPWLYMIGMFNNRFNLIYLLLFYVVFGLVTGYLTRYTKSLWPATLLHAVNNFLA